MKFCGNCGAQLPQTAREEGERRRVTILFADVSGFTTLSEQLGAEEVFHLMNRCYKRMGQVLEQHGGTVDKFMGDCIMALFGAPVAHENDPERAARAALAMQAELKLFNQEQQWESGAFIQMRIGINMGSVIAGAMGSDQQRQYTVMGDAVNVASRLQALAEPGGILVASTVRDQTCHLFRYRERGETSLKGKEQTVSVFELLEPFETESRFIASRAASLVGRQREIERLQRALMTVDASQHAIIHILGDIGLGKSRLLSEMLAFAGSLNARCLHTSCHVGENHISYHVIRKLLLQLFEIPTNAPIQERRALLDSRLDAHGLELGESAPFFYAAMGVSVPLPTAHEAAQRMAARAILEVFQAACQSSPLMVFIDDLQWIDLPSRDALAEIASNFPFVTRADSHGAALACAFRPEECQPSWEADIEIRLEPLTPQQTEDLAQELLNTDSLPKPVLDQIVERSGGNPLFVEEIARGLVEMGALVQDETGWIAALEATEMVLPAAVEAAMTARIDRLHPEEKRALQIAAVIGHTFSAPLLQRVSNIEESRLLPVLNCLEKVAFLQTMSRDAPVNYAFRQPLAREVAYQMLLQANRRAYHESTAQAMESLFEACPEDYYEQIAYHYARSDNREKAIEYLMKAGQKAMSLFDVSEARACFTDVLERIDALPYEARHQKLLEQLCCFESAGDAYSLLGDYAQAIRYYENALKKLPSENCDSAGCDCRPDTLMRKIGRNYAKQARFSEAMEWLERARQKALSDSGTTSHRELARIWAELAVVALRQGHYSEAAEYAFKGRQLSEQVGTMKEIGDCCLVQGVVQHSQGDLAQAEENFRASLRIREQVGDLVGIASALNNLGNLLYDGQRYEEASAMYQRSYELREKMGHKEGMSLALVNLGNVAQRLKRYEEAKERFEKAIALATEIGSHYTANGGRVSAARARLLSGDQAGARVLLAAAKRETEQYGIQDLLCLTESLSSEAALMEGDLESALDAAERALALAQQVGSKFHQAAALRSHGYALVAAGDAQTGQRTLQEAIALFEEAGSIEEADSIKERAANLSPPS